ncbi:S1C family serine protease [Pseudonocardia oroxyli]|uniref:Serine protease, S1-C subfamily, contains C-terminal PDZ domain n=1 Tax=Pseudonocardia oroxyli TaxID=366584 RepID=A0A1G7QK56_PSEOR|nr:trypsin-like peptidase domain-containing protein [Pseudonocardia oroxyli]SDF98931.1 serine protease, S1-C subfamily, contains C-terminal PDZ domain [Pseudonocardia oroxyli]
MSDAQDPADRDAPPRLGPRGLDRPPVDPEAASVFGRPEGVDGAFGDRATSPNGSRTRLAPAPTAALAGAFGRAEGSTGPALQRPPETGGPRHPDEDAFWDGDTPAREDPWRRPETGVELGPPPVADRPPVSAPVPGPRLSVREVLFGGRVQPRALVVLGLIALLVGAVGGMVGRYTVEGANSLTDPGATLAEVSEAKERPPGSVADVAARVLPAVVSIDVKVGDQGGTGSGVVIDPAGYVLTNNHVIAPATNTPNGTVQAVFNDGTRVPAAVVGRDPKTDLAVLKVQVTNPTVAQFGSRGGLAVGDSVIAIGSPLGLAGTVTTGIVSALDRPVRLDGQGDDIAVIDAVQTDAAINPGNSGGALVDATGAVVGINTAIRSLSGGQDEGGSIGLGFAIPIDDARGIAEELIRTGTVTHADLGVNARSVTDGSADGAQVQNVVAGGPAAQAGILEGDVLVKVRDRTIAGADELIVAVREGEPGEAVPVELIRDGRPLTVTVTLGSD